MGTSAREETPRANETQRTTSEPSVRARKRERENYFVDVQTTLMRRKNSDAQEEAVTFGFFFLGGRFAN